MANSQLHSFDSFSKNPFEVHNNTSLLIQKLDEIDSNDLRCKFKSAQDPINIAFQSIEDAPLDKLAKDFVKDTIFDFVSMVKEFIRN